jgi:hypothetical protein
MSKMNSRKLFGILVLLIPLLVNKTFAQNSIINNIFYNSICEFNNREYDSAQAELKKVFNRNSPYSVYDKIEAGKLLISYYLNPEINDSGSAVNIADSILILSPSYKPDYDEYKWVFSQLIAEPRFIFGVFGGANYPFVNVIKQYSVFPSINSSFPGYYHQKYNFQAGLQGEYNVYIIKKKSLVYPQLYIQITPGYRKNEYVHVIPVENGANTSITYTENLSYIDIPVSAKCYFSHSFFWKPYIQLGAYFTQLIASSANTQLGVNSIITNRMEQRYTSVQVGYFGGIGIVHNLKKVTNLSWFLNINYVNFPHLVNNPVTRYDDPVNTWNFYYVDDDFKLDNLQANAGLSITIGYKIIKL